MVGEPLECLDRGPHGAECQGKVEYRYPLSGTGKSFPRCDLHWKWRVEEQERINKTYGPTSDVAPSWIDEADAGERWDDDY